MEGQISVGHPVDIGSGFLWTTAQDLAIPGRFPLAWERRYSTGLLKDPPGAFGPGWTCPFFARLTRIGKDWHFTNAEGALVVLPDPDDAVDHGQVVRNLGSFTEIAKEGYFLKVTKWATTGDVTRHVFKPDRFGQWWPLQGLEGPAGQGLDLAWDDQGRLKGVRQRLERRTLAVETRPDGRIVALHFLRPDRSRVALARFEYDAQARLAAAFDALGFADRYEYDRDGRLTREIGKDGAVFQFKYDDQGRCVRTVGPGGYDLKVLRYFDNTGWAEVTDSLGNTTRYERLPTGQIARILAPGGGASLTEYDAHGRVVKEENAVGAATEYAYDDAGNRNLITDALGGVTELTFTDLHVTASRKDAAGNIWKREFDVGRRPVKLIDPLGHAWTIVYDGAGNPVQVTNPAGAVQKRVFSPEGVLLEATDWMSNRSRYRHDEFGRTIEKIDPAGAIYQAAWNLLGRPTAERFPDGTTTEFKYDAGGNVIRYQGRDGTATEFRYGFCGRLLEKRDRSGFLLKYEYGTEPGQLNVIRNRKGEEYRYWRDADKRVIRERGFDGSEYGYAYDAAGRLTRMTRPDGVAVVFEYDAGDRNVKITYPDGESVFTYDQTNRMISAANSETVLVLERDALGRIVKESQGGNDVLIGFDPMGRVGSLKSTLGADFASEFDGNGSLIALRIAGHGRIVFQRNALGLPVAQTLPGGHTLSQEWDSLGRLLEQRYAPHPSDGATAFDPGAPDSGIERRYARGRQGEVLAIDDRRWGKVAYGYDPMDRLLRATWESGPREIFAHDPEGNLASYSDGFADTSADYGPGGRLRRFGPSEYEYDARARLARRIGPGGSETAFAWNASDRLIGLTSAAGERWSYGYDALGKRVRKEGPGGKTRYLWFGDVILHAFDDASVRTFAYERSTGRPLAQIRDGAVTYLIGDHLGTPREGVDAGGRVVWAARYLAYGALAEAAGGPMDCPLRFRGQWHDPESGLHYNVMRYYDPETGRYISPDPIRLLGGLNVYAYAPNPINFTDPLGLATPQQIGTFSELSSTTGGDPNSNLGDNLDAHEMIRHKYLAETQVTPASTRHPDNPAIALSRQEHVDVHRHEMDVREERGLGRRQMSGDVQTEIEIMREAMKRAGIPDDKISELEEKAKQFAKDKKCK